MDGFKTAKIDLHRHLGGSINQHTVYKILEIMGRPMPLSYIADRMICHGRAIGFQNFLHKFTILDELEWYPWAIDLAIEQVCADLCREGVLYTELSLSINKYASFNAWTPVEVVKFIADKFSEYSIKYDIHVGLLLALRYDSSRDSQIDYSDIIDDPQIADRLCGLDLVGDESYFDPEFYKPIFNKWKRHDKILRAHVGEMPGTGENVRIAVEELEIDRIAHGVQASDDTLKMAAEKQICFDIALHSNQITGAVPDLQYHPLKKMIEYGCCVTLNTDDPVQFQCTLDDEFALAIASGLMIDEHSVINNAWTACRYSS